MFEIFGSLFSKKQRYINEA